MGCLAKSVQEKDILTLFSPVGKLTDLQFHWQMHGPRKGEPKGYCFLAYDTTEAATAAIKALNGTRLHGRNIVVRYQQQGDGGGEKTAADSMRAMLAKARTKSMQQKEGRGGGGGGGGGRDKRRKDGQGGGQRSIGTAMAPQRPKPQHVQQGSSREARGGEAEEESALEAKIRLLKAKIAAGSK